MTTQANSIAVIDFEARGLAQESWPIEIGVSFVVEHHVQTWSSFIRPEVGWSTEACDPQAEQVHGIKAADLADAPLATEVAAQLLRCIGSRIVLSDAADFDQNWLNKLLVAAGRSPDEIMVENFNSLVADLVMSDRERRERIRRYLVKTRPPHRVGPHADRLMRALLPR